MRTDIDRTNGGRYNVMHDTVLPGAGNGGCLRRNRLPCRPEGLSAVSVEVARRKLDQINRVRELGELAAPPGNRLERLHDDRHGQHSIRINQQYRICFRWENGHAFEVEITDYH